MKKPYLEVTYRKGRPVAAYLYAPRDPETKSVKTTQALPGVLVDWDATGRPIGIEITCPADVDTAAVLQVWHDLGVGTLDPIELAPLGSFRSIPESSPVEGAEPRPD